ncbi:helix-turn-helix domain-containing protein [Haloplasma contractile]|uniref:DNA-binding protein n=1 Tax=Haloplasma contractile SSD-17B TaxID=1033810 RepID=F7PW43_9MOLU|nr:helix-turn-helix domain-containing protein [Haloplasma contractile]ERJ12727.1 DNA-binding protein [Haloplasma contractile SSD-17B]
MDQIEIGKRIRVLRKEKKLTLEQIAGDHFTRGYISQIELGRVKPSFTVLAHIANQLDVKIEDLIITNNEYKQINDLLLKLEIETTNNNYSNAISLIKNVKIKIKHPFVYKINLYEAKAYFHLKKYNECIRIIKQLFAKKDVDNVSLYKLEAYALYGDALFNLGLYKESIIQYDQLISYAQNNKLPYNKRLANIYLNKATAYQNLKDYDTAIFYYTELLSFMKHNKILEPLLDAYIRIGFCYYKKGNLETAKIYINDGFQINKILDNDIQQAESQIILSYINFEEGKYNSAEEYCKKSLSVFENINSDNGIIESMYILAKIYKYKNKLDEGVKTLNDLYILIEKTNLKQINKDLIKDIATLYMDYNLHQEASFLFSVLVKNLYLEEKSN